MLQPVTVLPLFAVAVVVLVPLERIPLAGVAAPSEISQVSMMLLSLPLAPVVVLNSTTALDMDASAAVNVTYLIRLLLASLMKRTAAPLTVSAFAIVRFFAVPPTVFEPSMITLAAPFRFKSAVT